MRLWRSAVLVVLLSLAISAHGQTAQVNGQSANDPQAVAIVQAAITALGGATAIGQCKAWDLNGILDGPIDSGNLSETISIQAPNTTVTVNGATRPASKLVHASLFVPALVGMILLQETQDASYEVHLDPLSASDPSTKIVRFVRSGLGTAAQTWVFDAATNLPTRILFVTSGQLGRSITHRALVDLSDYKSVSGVLYPFHIMTYTVSRSPQSLTIQTLDPSTTISITPAGGAL